MGIFLVLVAGVCNLYPIYLSKMQSKFGYSIKEVNLYGTFINIGIWVAFPMGYIYDKLGPKISCLIGGLLLSGSYLTLYFIFGSALTHVNLAIFLVIAILMGQGSALCYFTSITTNLKNFRFKESSSIVGLLVANLALSPSIFTTYKNHFKDSTTASFFLSISIFSFIIILFSGFIFQNIKRIYSEEEKQKTYETYKEKKIIRVLIIINLFILIVYIFSVIYNHMQENIIPLVIIYPCLQCLNFIVVILEKAKVFDRIYFESYINKKLMKTNTKPLRQDTSILTLANDSNNNNNNNDNNINDIDNNIKKQFCLNKPNIDESNKEIVEIRKKINSDSDLSNENLFVSCKDSQEIITDNNKNLKENVSNKNSNENGEKVYSKEIIKKDNLDISLNNNQEKVNKDIIHVNINFNDETKMEENVNEIEDEINFKNLKKVSEKPNNDINTLDKKSIKIQEENTDKTSRLNFNIDNPTLSLPNIDENNINSRNNFNLHRNSLSSIENENASKTFKSAVLTKEFLFLLLILIFGIGSVIANLNNISFIYDSIILIKNVNPINDSQIKSNLSDVSQYVILYFVFNSLTRIISGLILDYLIREKKFVNFLIFISIIGLISQLLGIFMNKYLLFVSVCFAGATHGGYLTFAPVYVRNEYGLINMGKILGLLTSGCAIGSFFIADFIFIMFYEWQIWENSKNNPNILTNINSEKNNESKCYGEECFRYSYVISSILFMINVGLSYFIYRRYNKKHTVAA